MTNNSQKLIRKARLLFVLLIGGVTLLALESILLKTELFRQVALGLAATGLLVISLIVAGIVKSQE